MTTGPPVLPDAADELVPPDSGHIDEDLRAHLRHVTRFLVHSDAGAVLKALLGQAQHDPAMATVFRDRYLSLQRGADMVLFTRAMARGDLSPDLDTEAALDQLIGPIYYRVLVTGADVGATFTDRLVEQFLAANRVTPAGT